MKLTLTGILALLAIGMAGAASAASNEEIIKEVLAGKYGEVVVPKSDQHIMTLTMNANLWYQIDIKAHMCYQVFALFEGVGSYNHETFETRMLVPCQSLKKGYPIVAPVITWND